jgi:hypothetical protein
MNFLEIKPHQVSRESALHRLWPFMTPCFEVACISKHCLQWHQACPESDECLDRRRCMWVIASHPLATIERPATAAASCGWPILVSQSRWEWMAWTNGMFLQGYKDTS